MTILFYVIIGLIAGAIAKAIMPGKQGGGIIATIILGVVGALVGGLIGNLISGNGFDFSLQGNWFISLIIAILGSLLVLFIYGAVTKRRRV
ncbi:GlsB/YeaQ/YmgE family stress response membrane protein [Auraticoccus sp. F435]|uniref:GlsB/YeaQ/YmgE family stress response membrane protein n=1 Tax=Auraticoccus cholistanensis TaxID=2656650 RepID=A0A6A9V129_9ACTN|nr:GlsB/YeaQ/YmgE family stress response membrane protein [Auraticoccus cholistanensis]MVA76380.1 GlsB/YeaQ/YmgE family stress response membrane protein [Auraticoccus cholistanensis]